MLLEIWRQKTLHCFCCNSIPTLMLRVYGYRLLFWLFQYPKAKLEPSPYIMVRLGEDSQQTPIKTKTVNPLFQSKMLFFVCHPERHELKFEVQQNYFWPFNWRFQKRTFQTFWNSVFSVSSMVENYLLFYIICKTGYFEVSMAVFG